MQHRRHAKTPPLVSSSRSLLAAEQCPAIDGVLKQLKACSRRLQAALASHRTELQILERLYYKGKNQHRTALFWQRVAEMRRFGDRVDEMHMDDIVESLRLSFWGEPSARTAKALKGPWTHYPDAKPLLFVLERCSASCALIEKARDRLLGTYQSFTLMMQTGAFLQLILTLAAIASRMSTLLSEVKAALEMSWSTSYSALQTLSPSEAGKVKKPAIHSHAEQSLSNIAPSTPECMAISSARIPQDVPDEDLGNTLVRTSTHVVDETTTSTNPTSIDEVSGQILDDERLDTATFSLSSELQVAQSSGVPAATSTLSSVAVSKRKKSDMETLKIAKKKIKKKDEIDDIFGF